MVKIDNIEVHGIERAINAINNSFNVGAINTTEKVAKKDRRFNVAKSLFSNMDPHQSHDAALKGILVTFDMRHNGVFMPEFQRYHWAEIIMSQSTMHSMEKFMTSDHNPFTKYVTKKTKEHIKELYENWQKEKQSLKDYCTTTPEENRSQGFMKMLHKDIYLAFETLVHNLPRGLELWATITTNYLQLKTIVIQRAKHKNEEDWGNFIEFCYGLPHFRELCGFEDSKWDLGNLFPIAFDETDTPVNLKAPEID